MALVCTISAWSAKMAGRRTRDDTPPSRASPRSTRLKPGSTDSVSDREMNRRGARLIAGSGAVALVVTIAVVANQLPAVGAGGLLHPARHRVAISTPDSCR